jgi:DNA-binding response OmpR family regulator
MLVEWDGIELPSEFTCPSVAAQPLFFILAFMRGVEEQSYLFGGSLHKTMERKRILIIEDELETAMTLCRVLVDDIAERYQVDVCPLADVALKRLRYERYDLIVTDLRMPGMSGLELIRYVRQTSPQTHLMLITGFGSPPVESQVRQLGATYLPKPFSLREFMAAIHCILSEEECGAWQDQASGEKEMELQLCS